MPIGGAVALDLYDIEYLRSGSPRQRRGYAVLTASGVLEKLRSDSLGDSSGAILAGSLPIDLALDDSDLDIVTSSSDLKAYSGHMRELFGRELEFRSARGIVLGVPSLVTQFRIESDAGGEVFEIFTQQLPMPMQNAVRHLLIEERLLALGGARFREAVWQARLAGHKTEPAFGLALRLAEDVDPYRELLALEDLSDSALKIRFAHCL